MPRASKPSNPSNPSKPSNPSSKLPSKLPNSELVLGALEVVLQHAVEMLSIFINKGNEPLIGLSIEKAASKKNIRNLLATMLNKLPVSCKHLRGVAAGDGRYGAILFYERTRLGASNSGHFLEGLCAGLSMFTGPTQVVLQDDDLRKLKLRDVIADRVRTVANLEALRNNEQRLLALVNDYTLYDIASGIPGRVHVFLARMRAICQGLRRVKPPEQTKQCHNCECSRLFYCGARSEISGAEATAEDLFGESKPQTEGDYWSLVAGGREELDHQNEFCTWTCYRQWKNQLHQALPDSNESFLVADYQTRKTGRSRVGEALRLISKRNEQAGRHLRILEKERKVFPAVEPAELRDHRERRIRALNVDLGLVYAASLLAESKSLSNGKVLAGSTEGWRSRAMFYAKQIKEIGKLYEKYHVGGNVISNLHVTEPFLNKIKTKAARLV